jgi:hypothetical protein
MKKFGAELVGTFWLVLGHSGGVTRGGFVEVDKPALDDFLGQRGLTFRFSSGDTPPARTGC